MSGPFQNADAAGFGVVVTAVAETPGISAAEAIIRVISASCLMGCADPDDAKHIGFDAGSDAVAR